MSAGVYSIRVGNQSITLNELASKKFTAKEIEVSAVCLYDAESQKAAIQPSTGFEKGQFKITQHPKSRYVRVVGMKPFLVATGMIGGDSSMFCRDVRCEWDDATQTLSWTITGKLE